MLAPPLAPVTGALLTALAFNLHYPLFRRPLLEGPLTSRPVLGLLNPLVGAAVRMSLSAQGVPSPSRSERYGSGRVDIFEPADGGASQARPAVLYFHGGAFIAGHRSFGAGTCSWLASKGSVALSASYRRTGRGTGVAGCIEDAWAALRWTRANADRLGIDPNKVTVAGDSAGGLLALALATGLQPSSEAPVDLAELPAAAVVGWAVSSLDAATYYPRRADDGRSWEGTPAGRTFAVPNAFVEERHGGSAEATQARLHS